MLLRRKILLLVPRGADEWKAVVSLMEALHRDIIVKEVGEDTADLSELTYPWWEREFEDFFEEKPTEILYWPGIPVEDKYRQWGISQSLSQTKISDFLLKYWEQEIVLPVETHLQHNGFPLLWSFLSAGGFEPSIVWKDSDGQWYVKIGRGIHWVVAKEWLEKCGFQGRIGREPERFYANSYWLIQDERVDFYQDQEAYFYLGSLERLINEGDEKAILDTALHALQLGVPLSKINSIIAPVSKQRGVHSIYKDTNSRRHMDDTEGDKGESGKELLLEPIEYVENRRSS